MEVQTIAKKWRRVHLVNSMLCGCWWRIWSFHGLLRKKKWTFTLQTEWFILKLTLLNSRVGGFNPFSDTSKTNFLVELSIRPQYLAISNPPMFMGKSRVNRKSVKCRRNRFPLRVCPHDFPICLAAEITSFVKICMHRARKRRQWGMDTQQKHGRQIEVSKRMYSMINHVCLEMNPNIYIYTSMIVHMIRYDWHKFMYNHVHWAS